MRKGTRVSHRDDLSNSSPGQEYVTGGGAEPLGCGLALFGAVLLMYGLAAIRGGSDPWWGTSLLSIAFVAGGVAFLGLAIFFLTRQANMRVVVTEDGIEAYDWRGAVRYVPWDDVLAMEFERNSSRSPQQFQVTLRHTGEHGEEHELIIAAANAWPSILSPPPREVCDLIGHVAEKAELVGSRVPSPTSIGPKRATWRKRGRGGESTPVPVEKLLGLG